MTTNLPMLPYFMSLIKVCDECHQSVEQNHYIEHVDGHTEEFKDRQRVVSLKLNWPEYAWREYKDRKHGEKKSGPEAK